MNKKPLCISPEVTIAQRVGEASCASIDETEIEFAEGISDCEHGPAFVMPSGERIPLSMFAGRTFTLRELNALLAGDVVTSGAIRTRLQPALSVDHLPPVHASPGDASTRSDAAWALECAEWIFGPEKRARVFDQIVADMRIEVSDAIVSGSAFRVLAARARGYVALARAAGIMKIIKTLGRAYALFRHVG